MIIVIFTYYRYFFLARMDLSEQNRDEGFAVDVMRRPFQTKHTNDRMLIDNLPK